MARSLVTIHRVALKGDRRVVLSETVKGQSRVTVHWLPDTAEYAVIHHEVWDEDDLDDRNRSRTECALVPLRCFARLGVGGNSDPMGNQEDQHDRDVESEDTFAIAGVLCVRGFPMGSAYCCYELHIQPVLRAHASALVSLRRDCEKAIAAIVLQHTAPALAVVMVDLVGADWDVHDATASSAPVYARVAEVDYMQPQPHWGHECVGEADFCGYLQRVAELRAQQRRRTGEFLQSL